MIFLYCRPSVLRICGLRPNRVFSSTCIQRKAGKTLKESAPVVDPLECRSSCPANTVLTGLTYLKDQPAVLALPDEEYPSWLWTILEPKVYGDEGPGSKSEQVKRRRENRIRIKEQNFMKTQ